MQYYYYVVSLLLGLVVGSFLNVVIYRLPRRESIVRPGSRCPGCGTAIRFYDNIPVLSWLVLRGRCRACGDPDISPLSDGGGHHGARLCIGVLADRSRLAAAGRLGFHRGHGRSGFHRLRPHDHPQPDRHSRCGAGAHGVGGDTSAEVVGVSSRQPGRGRLHVHSGDGVARGEWDRATSRWPSSWGQCWAPKSW